MISSLPILLITCIKTNQLHASEIKHLILFLQQNKFYIAHTESYIRKVLVTGGTGFLGAYIIQQLIRKGYFVKAIRRNNKLPFFMNEEIFKQVEWMDGDVLDVICLEDAMQNVDAVIHAAAKISFIPNERDAMMQTNIEGTANVVNIALAQNIKRVVYVSSIAALGRNADGDTVNEEKKWQESKLNTNYAISKYNAEVEVWRAIGEGLNAAIVNPSTIIGYGDWNTSSCAIFKNVYEEFPWYTNGINGFVHVEDVANAIVLLMETDINGERFIVNSENYSFKKLFDMIADGFHKKHPTREATPALAEIAWRLEKIKSVFTHKPSLLTKESATIALGKTYFDNSKFLQHFPGFSFTPLQQTVEQACKLYLQNVNPS